jgi:hypothetical protein
VHTSIPTCAYTYVKSEMDQRGGVVIIFESISHEECESWKVVFSPVLLCGLVDGISATILLPLV